LGKLTLGGRAAREAYNEGLRPLPSRQELREAVNREEAILRQSTRSRKEEKSAHRRAVEMVLLGYGLMEIEGEVSHDFLADVWTK
jgi:predicted component of type VI protein secretion system